MYDVLISRNSFQGRAYIFELLISLATRIITTLAVMITCKLCSETLNLGKVVCHLILHLGQVEILQHVGYGIL